MTVAVGVEGGGAAPEEPAGSPPPPHPPVQREPATRLRRRSRLARGPVVIGEPAAEIEPLVAAAEPYRPDTVADGGTAFGLTVRAASVRGLFKRYVGGARQDDLCLAVHEPSRTLVVAVADGVSGAARSHVGAALAVRHATAAVLRGLEQDPEELAWNDVFQQAAWALIDEQRRSDGATRSGVPQAAAALATTLTVAAITAGASAAPRVRVAAVGDSPALLLRDRDFSRLLDGELRGDGLIGGAVQALPRHAGSWTSAEGELTPGAALLVATDGLALPLGDGSGEVGAVFARELQRVPEVIDFARLLDFSRSTYDDDRTLVAVWPPSG